MVTGKITVHLGYHLHVALLFSCASGKGIDAVKNCVFTHIMSQCSRRSANPRAKLDDYLGFLGRAGEPSQFSIGHMSIDQSCFSNVELRKISAVPIDDDLHKRVE